MHAFLREWVHATYTNTLIHVSRTSPVEQLSEKHSVGALISLLGPYSYWPDTINPHVGDNNYYSCSVSEPLPFSCTSESCRGNRQ